jgi:hypothetical protein
MRKDLDSKRWTPTVGPLDFPQKVTDIEYPDYHRTAQRTDAIEHRRAFNWLRGMRELENLVEDC